MIPTDGSVLVLLLATEETTAFAFSYSVEARRGAPLGVTKSAAFLGKFLAHLSTGGSLVVGASDDRGLRGLEPLNPESARVAVVIGFQIPVFRRAFGAPTVEVRVGIV